MSKTTLLANEKLTNFYYIDPGTSDHLVPSKGELQTYKGLASPVRIATTDSGKIYACGTGPLQVAPPINGLERQDTLEDVYYTPGVRVRLVALRKLEGQGWDFACEMAECY